MLFTAAEGYGLTYSADSDDTAAAPASASGNTVTVMAQQPAEMVHITITATGTPMASGARSLPQTSPNVAQVIFPVDVVNTDLMITVSTDPMGMVDEGGMLKVIATSAGRAILAGEEATVMLNVQGPVEDGSEHAITIAAGETTGSIDLMVSNDNVVADLSDIVITASGAGIDGAQVVTVSVVEDDAETTYAVAPGMVSVEEGGGAVEITATASHAVLEDITIMLTHGAGNASEDDYSVDAIMIGAGETVGSTTLTAFDDTEVEGMERVTLTAVLGSVIVGRVEVEIADNDAEITYTLEGPADMNVVEGVSYEITATAISAVPADTTVEIMRDRAASNARDDDYTVENITIMAGETLGTTMLIVTEDDMPDGGTGTNMGEMLVLFGMVDGMQTNSLTFIIWDAAVPALPVVAQLLLAAFLAIGGYRRYLRR